MDAPHAGSERDRPIIDGTLELPQRRRIGEVGFEYRLIVVIGVHAGSFAEAELQLLDGRAHLVGAAGGSAGRVARHQHDPGAAQPRTVSFAYRVEPQASTPATASTAAARQIAVSRPRVSTPPLCLMEHADAQ